MIDKTTLIILILMVAVITICSLFRKLENKRMYKSSLGKYMYLIDSCKELKVLSQQHSFYLDISIVSFISLWIFLYLGIKKKDALFILIALVLLIISLILMTKILRISNTYNQKYKNQIVEKIFKFERTDLQYNPYVGINKKDYEETKFNKFDKYESDNLIQGILPRGTSFILSDVVTYEKVNYEKTNVSTYSQNFHGSFAIIKLNKSINGFMYLLDKSFILVSNDYYLDVNDKRFDKEYDIFTSNKEIIKKIFNQNVLKRILELKEKYNIPFEMKINNNIVYFRFHNKSLFTPSITNTKQEAIRISQYFNIIDGMINIMDELCNYIESSI